jgi:hypothetical protein
MGLKGYRLRAMGQLDSNVQSPTAQHRSNVRAASVVPIPVTVFVPVPVPVIPVARTLRAFCSLRGTAVGPVPGKQEVPAV